MNDYNNEAIRMVVNQLNFAMGRYTSDLDKIRLLEINRLLNNFNLSLSLIEVILGIIVEYYVEDNIDYNGIMTDYKYFNVSQWIEDYKQFLHLLGYDEKEILGLYIVLDNLLNPYDNMD